MSPLEIGALAIAALLLLILIGMHIGVAMLTVSLVAVATIRNDRLPHGRLGRQRCATISSRWSHCSS